jgi:hypothetical protein
MLKMIINIGLRAKNITWHNFINCHSYESTFVLIQLHSIKAWSQNMVPRDLIKFHIISKFYNI